MKPYFFFTAESCDIAQRINRTCPGRTGRRDHSERLWQLVTRLNERHMLLAWISLFVVALTDLYIRLLAQGHLHDFKII